MYVITINFLGDTYIEETHPTMRECIDLINRQDPEEIESIEINPATKLEDLV